VIVIVALVGIAIYELNGAASQPPTVKYHLSIGIQGSGSKTPTPGNYTYDAGASVSITATPSSGSALDYWSLDGVNMSRSSTISVTMKTDHRLVAVFGIITPPQNMTVVYERDPQRFDPKVLNITVGTTVEWINGGTEIHMTTSNNGTWNNGIMNMGDKFYYMFTKSGKYPYFCAVHIPEMVGIVVGRPK